jgi:hypothetical protein
VSQDVIDTAVKIDIDMRPGRRIENKDGGILSPIEPLFQRAHDLGRISCSNPTVTLEGHVAGQRQLAHISPANFSVYCPGNFLRQ